MPGGEEALRVDDELAIAARIDKRLNRLGGFGLQRTTRRDNGDANATGL